MRKAPTTARRRISALATIGLAGQNAVDHLYSSHRDFVDNVPAS